MSPPVLAQSPSPSTGIVEGRVTDDYDTRVPLFLFGKGIAAGEYLNAASPTDVAPTLAFLAGITLPHVDGRVLTEALTGDIHPARTSSAR